MCVLYYTILYYIMLYYIIYYIILYYIILCYVMLYIYIYIYIYILYLHITYNNKVVTVTAMMPHPTIQTNSFSRVDHLSRTSHCSRDFHNITHQGTKPPDVDQVWKPIRTKPGKGSISLEFLECKATHFGGAYYIFFFFSCSSPPISISISINIILNSYAQGQTYPDFLVHQGSLISGADCGHRSHQSGPAQPCAVLRPATQI